MIPHLGRRGEGWVALQFALLGVIGLLGVVDRDGWPEPVRTPLRVVGVVVVATGAVVAVLALTGLGSALTAVPAPLEGARLRTGGIYGVVRHPIYAGLLLLAAGWSLATSPWALLVTAVLAVELDLKRRVEEGFLGARYPEYADYRVRVPHALLPGLW